ncbi:MAG TPA: restriction endonuclease subunit S [Rhodopila sp.]|uniref:restriction endonuclease subunit S n=1 Tax=Rhodopila sp. TaxID=2480087 RepID=UPI002B65FEAF|nr:restriction endonuclease subunit S [Rhodopila sp.]HVY17233.1 restriction endonuclease subunit S [Rhodopila sp.]
MRWPKVPVGELVYIQGGGTPSKANEAFFSGTIPWVTPKDMKSWFIFDSEMHITSSAIEQSAAKMIDASSVLLVVRSGILKHTLPVAINTVPIAINQDMKALTCKGRIDPHYLARILKSSEGEILTWTRATTADNFPIERLRSLEIPLPPLSEQRRIAATLDEADALRAKRRAALAKLDEMAQAIFVEMFGSLQNPRITMNTRSFGSFADIKLGKMLDKKRQLGQPKFLYLRNANVRWFDFQLDDLYQMEFSAEERSQYSLARGDILICEGGEPGRAAIWKGQVANCYYQKALHRVRLDPELAIPENIVWVMWLLAKDSGLKDHVTISTIAHLTKEKLERLTIPLPTLNEQRMFARRIADLEKIKTSLNRACDGLDFLFASLQHRAFRGEL